MTEVIRFKANHITQMEPIDHVGTAEGKHLTEEHFQIIEEQCEAYTIKVDGKVMACVGAVEYWSGRAAVWGILDRNAGQKFVQVTRSLIDLIEELPYRRIESTVVKDYEKGHRLNKLLGFKMEVAEMKKYGMNGETHALYSRVR